MGDKNVDDSDMVFTMILCGISGFLIALFFCIGFTSGIHIDNAYITWEEQNITDIIYYDDGIISDRYPVEGITKEIVIEIGEVLGINIDMLSIGDAYNMHIYRDNYKGNNVAWIDACDNVVI